MSAGCPFQVKGCGSKPAACAQKPDAGAEFCPRHAALIAALGRKKAEHAELHEEWERSFEERFGQPWRDA